MKKLTGEELFEPRVVDMTPAPEPAGETTVEPPKKPQGMKQEPLQSRGPLSLNAVINYLRRDEMGAAECLSALFWGRICFDATEKQWYTFRGGYWRPDITGEVRLLVSNHVAAEYIQAAAKVRRKAADDEAQKLAEALLKAAKRLRYKSRIDNVLSLATNLPELATDGAQWDNAPMLLPVENGLIDLLSGEFRPGEPTDYLRVHAPTRWEGLNTPAPKWEAFLLDVFNTPDMVAFMRRLMGYAITGACSERVFPVTWGTGANGKSTFLETIGAVLGSSLALAISAKALMSSRKSSNGPNPTLYSMRGKRLVWASESAKGARLDVDFIKWATGNDTITTRDMYKSLVSFRPSHTLFLVTNNKPHIPADDTAIWDRVLLIPFTSRFTDHPQGDEKQKRKGFGAELLAEASGILAWLVRGALEWQQQGLNPPATVLRETENYRNEEDTFGMFLDECTLEGEGLSAKSSTLYGSYKQWCSDYNITPMSLTAFGREMGKRYEKRKTNTGMAYFGIGLLTKD